MSIQALRERRGTIAAALKELVAKPEFDAVTDQATYDNAMAEVDKIDASIKRINDANAKLAEDASNHSVADVAARIGRDKGKPEMTLYSKWLKSGDNGLSAAEWADIRNTMSTTTTTEGGFTVQSDVAAALIDALKDFGGMRSVATILRTEKGNPLSFPTSDGTSEVGEWIAENVTATALDPVFGSRSLPVYKASSKIAAVPFELLQDSQIDIEAFVNGRLAARLGRITNTGYTVGTGTAQPTGLITAATAGVTAANATSQVSAIIYDSVVNLIHSVDPAYRVLGNCRFMMNDASIKVIRQVKDTAGRPIFVPGYDGTHGNLPAFSAPDTLCGYPIVTNQDIAVMAAGAKSIAFGDFSYYYIRDAMDISMFRFTDSAYAKLGQVGFLAWMRSGGNLLDTGAVRLFVNAAT
ncbi:MAG: phage major capsid protein [Microgenomates group bacterium]